MGTLTLAPPSNYPKNPSLSLFLAIKSILNQLRKAVLSPKKKKLTM